MTTPSERTRSLIWAGGFLIELARDKRLPLEVRRQAVVIARHFPTKEDVSSMSDLLQPLWSGSPLASPEIEWMTECQYGPLRDGTRLGWPE